MEDYLWYETTQSLAYNLSLPNEHAVSQSDPPLPAISVFSPSSKDGNAHLEASQQDFKTQCVISQIQHYIIHMPTYQEKSLLQ